MSTNRTPSDGNQPADEATEQRGTPESDISSEPLDDAELLQRITGIQFDELPSMLLKPTEVAEILNVPISTVRKMTKDGTLPTRMVGTNRRVPVPALVRWLTAIEAA